MHIGHRLGVFYRVERVVWVLMGERIVLGVDRRTVCMSLDPTLQGAVCMGLSGKFVRVLSGAAYYGYCPNKFTGSKRCSNMINLTWIGQGYCQS